MKETILVVDDDPSSLIPIVELLIKNGFDVLPSDSGELAISIAERRSVDLIILDLNLGGISGFDFCKKLKSDPKLQNIPIIFLTGSNNTDDRVKGLQMGGSDFITKPFVSEECFARINIHLKIGRLSKELESQILQNKKMFANLIESHLLASVGELASMISHEINNPLTVITGACSLFQDKINEKKSFDQSDLELFAYVMKSTKKIHHVVSRVRRYATDQDEKEATDLNYIIEEAISFVENLYHKSQIKIVFNKKAEHSSTTINHTKLNQIIMTMLAYCKNEIKQSAYSGSISVATTSEKELFCLSFRAIRKSSPTNNQFNLDSRGGLNDFSTLSLEISKKIILDEGGTIEIFSDPEVGTEIQISLPLSVSSGDGK